MGAPSRTTSGLSSEQVINEVNQAIRQRYERQYLGAVKDLPYGYNATNQTIYGRKYPAQIYSIADDTDIHRSRICNFACEGYALRHGNEVIIVAVGEPARMHFVDIDYGILANQIPRLDPDRWHDQLKKNADVLRQPLWFGYWEKSDNPFQFVSSRRSHNRSLLYFREVHDLQYASYKRLPLRVAAGTEVVRVESYQEVTIPTAYTSAAVDLALEAFHKKFFR